MEDGRQRGSSDGLTLPEVIVAIAILGILAAVSVPNFIRYRLQSKTSEALTNLAALREAEHAYYAENGSYVWAGSAPAGVPGPQRRPWTGGNTTEYRELLGFSAAGDVYFQYGVEGRGDAYTLTALSDLDGEGALAQFQLVHATPGEREGLPGVIGTCSPLGVHDPSTDRAGLLDRIGPCGAADGKSRL